MANNLDLAAALNAANTTYVARGHEIFEQSILPGEFGQYTSVIPNVGAWERHFIANHPMMQLWSGARVKRTTRAYSESLLPKKYEATMPVPRLQLVRDSTGSIGKAIDGFLSQQAMVHDKFVADAFDGNTGAGPTGYDGVALFADAHPHVNSGSGHDNLGGGLSLTHATANTARAAMRSYTFETGQPMNIRPTHVRVGPNNEERAKEIYEAKVRLKALDAAGVEATSSVVAAGSMDNVWQGELNVIVDPRVTTYYTTLMDLSGAMSPMVLIDERRPEPINLTEMTDPDRFYNDEFTYGLEGEWLAGAGEWQTCYRLTGTS